MRDSFTHRRHAVGALLLTLATVLSTGCSATRAGEDAATGTEIAEQTGVVMAQPTEVVAEEPPGAEDGGVEAGGPPPEEETSTSERPAEGGGGRVSIELAGLPVGGGEVLDADGSWCQVLFWRSVPAGVWLDIESVRVSEKGGSVSGSGCDGSPPCAGVRIAVDGPSGCAVLVRPPSPDVAFVEVQLNGTLSCPDQAACDELGATDGSWTRVSNPAGEGVPTAEPSTGGGDNSEGGGGRTSSDGNGNDGTEDDGTEDDGNDGDGNDDQASTGTG